MYRALQLAKIGKLNASPNPSVGAVLVHDNQIIGEGFTSAYGGSHAEVNAINSVSNKELLSQSVLYVTLEPCNHYGKTPPCSHLIVKSKIPKVIIGCIDSFSLVNGEGIKYLKSNNIEVEVGCLEEECLASNQCFFTFNTFNRPYISLKWAESSDGFIAPISKNEQKPVWLSNSLSRQISHKLRAENQAILVGKKTVIDDDPSLTTRDWYGKHPVRMYIDRSNKISNKYAIRNSLTHTVCFTTTLKENSSEEMFTQHIVENNNLLNYIMNYCFENKIQSLIVEGGAFTLQQFIDADLWDNAYVYKSNCTLCNGLNAPTLNSKKLEGYYPIKNNNLFVFSNLKK